MNFAQESACVMVGGEKAQERLKGDANIIRINSKHSLIVLFT